MSLFTEPFISAPYREAEYVLAKPQVVGQSLSSIAAPTPSSALTTDPLTASTLRDPFLGQLVERLDLIIAKGAQVEKEAVVIQKVMIRTLNRTMTNTPQYILDTINELVYREDGILYTPETPLRECDLACIATLAGRFGNDIKLDNVDKLARDLGDAKSMGEMIRTAANKGMAKLSGLDMFLFMVRFILAYAVHMTIGFLCCYFKDKLIIFKGLRILGVKLEIRIGDKISAIFGSVERFLKDLLGFPCRDPGAACTNADGSIPRDNLSIFPCCDQFCNGEAAAQPSYNTLSECLKNAVRKQIADVFGEDDPSKPCRMCQEQPFKITPATQAMANQVMNYLESISNADEIERNNEFNRVGANPTMIGPVASTIQTAKFSQAAAGNMKSALVDNWSYNRMSNDPDCGVLFAGGMGGLNKNPEDLTEEDLANAMLANIDIDYKPFVAKANKDIRSIDFDLNSTGPTLPPFAQIWQAMKAIDQALNPVLDEARKFLAGVQMLTAIPTSRDFCCVIWSIAFLVNLVKYGQLCPEDDFNKMFRYAYDFRNSAGLKAFLKFLRLLKKMIEALNAELIGDITIIGGGLPLGTLVELLKKVISNSIIAILAMAFAPIDRILTQLENNPGLKNLLNNNCFGIGDLFAMLHCGIGWIFDLIKQWVNSLLTFSARNIEIMPNITIGGMRMAFLANLARLLDMLEKLLLSIGDCYTPEEISQQIVNQVDKEAIATVQAMNQLLRNDDERRIYNNVIQPIPGLFQDPVPGVIQDIGIGAGQRTSSGGPVLLNTFTPFPGEMERFRQLILRTNEVKKGSPVASLPIEQPDATEQYLQSISGGMTREEAQGSVLNMVRALSNVSG